MVKVCCFALLLVSCIPKEKTKGTSAMITQALPAKSIQYDSCKIAIRQLKSKSSTQWKSLPTSQKQICFTNAVVHTILPAWYGTKWDYNGTTTKPQTGSIACGYFVTTVLRDAGLPIARVKLAQCASAQMIKAIVKPPFIAEFSLQPLSTFINYITLKGYGLYIVGLDNHTGFIYNDGEHIWFIHATYLGTADVQKENAANSKILANSKYKMIGKISADETLLNKWIQQ